MSGDKQAAVEFLQMMVAGDIEKAFQKYVDMRGKHHNPYCAAGMEGLKKGMMENDTQFPHKKFMVKHVVGDSDLVSVHSHLVLKPGELELATTHLMRFESGKIAEFWDVATAIPAQSPNQDGMF
ncbi:MAG TPA: nuclear transport factor 2 family protein [bacterium]|jgi:predicted SnoaL-like aldol condensation-catalyzing enzyme|nr:nuclear transport factor 2 family protein [bacterium]